MSIDHEDPRTQEQTQAPLPEVVAPTISEAPKNISRRALLFGGGLIALAGAGAGKLLGGGGSEVVTEAKPTTVNSAPGTPSSTPEASVSPEVVEPPKPELFTQEQLENNTLLEKISPEKFEVSTTFTERLRWVLGVMYDAHVKNTYPDFVKEDTRSGKMMAELNPFFTKLTPDTDGQTIVDYLLYGQNLRTAFPLDKTKAGELYVPLDTAKARKFVSATYLDPGSGAYQDVAQTVETSYTQTNFIDKEALRRQVVDSTEWIKGGYDIEEGKESVNVPAKKITMRNGNNTYEVTAVFLTFDLLGVNVEGLKNIRNNPIEGAVDGVWVMADKVMVK